MLTRLAPGRPEGSEGSEGGGIALTVHSEHILHYANWICKEASATRKSSESVTAEDEGALTTRKM